MVVGLDAVGRGSGASYREVIDGVEFRVSALSFFQTRPDGAEQLVSLLNTALADHHDVLIDLYGGVGLFAGTIGRRFQTVVSVEQEQSASDDAIVNLAHLDDANIVTEDVAEWRPSRSSSRRGSGSPSDPLMPRSARPTTSTGREHTLRRSPFFTTFAKGPAAKF